MRFTIPGLIRCLRSRRFLLSLAALAIAVGVAVFPLGHGGKTVLAHLGIVVDDSTRFELDRNFADPTSPAGDDWATLNPPTNLAGGAQVSPFVADPANATIFRGGDKDVVDVTAWGHTTGSSPDKDEITNAYAAAYNVSGDLIVYFGADRFSNDGDATLGIWLFQENVAPIFSGPDAGKFSGKHLDHDILIVLDFTQGGATPFARVLEWNPAFEDDRGKNLRQIKSAVQSECGSVSADPDVCAVENNTTLNGVPWTYSAKGNTTTPPNTSQQFPPGTFLEGGINVTHLLTAAGVTSLPCFTSMLFETRASDKPDAQLKDFVAAAFPVCAIDITKSCTGATVNTDGRTVHYTFNGIVRNDGIGNLFDILVTDTFPTGATNPVLTQPVIPGTGLAPGAANQVSYSGSFDFTAAGGVVNSVSVAAAPFSGGTPADRTVTDSATWTGCSAPVTPGLHLHKSCSVSLQPCAGCGLAIQVDIAGSVCNDGNTEITGITVTDNQVSGNILTNITLGPRPGGAGTETCQAFPSGKFYRPSSCPTPAPGEGGVCSFQDTVSASGTSALGGGTGGTVTATPVMATCHLCPSGVCSATSP